MFYQLLSIAMNGFNRSSDSDSGDPFIRKEIAWLLSQITFCSDVTQK